MSDPTITKQCSTCKQTKPIFQFSKDRSQKDGFQGRCKKCKSAYQKSKNGKAAQKRYRQSEKVKNIRKCYPQGAKRKTARKHYKQTGNSKVAVKRYNRSEKGKIVAKRRTLKYGLKYPEKIKARCAVMHAIEAGKLPRPDTLKCSCGKQAKEYHHYKGYKPEHWFDVIPKCIKCHRKLHNIKRASTHKCPLLS